MLTNGEGAMEFVLNQMECSQAEKRCLYLKNLKPVVLKDALFADGTKDYVQITDDEVRLYFRTGKNNVDRVYLWLNGEKLLMSKTETVGLFDYYRKDIYRPEKNCTYYFEIIS